MKGSAFLAVLLVAVGLLLIYAAVRGKGVLAPQPQQGAKQ